jgi:Type IV secretion system pilin
MKKTAHAVLIGLLLFAITIPVTMHAAGGINSTGPQVNAGSINSTGGNSSGQTLANPLKVNSLTELLNLILGAAITIGKIVLTLAIIWTGFLFIEARGNAEKISGARTALLWVVVGGLILLGAQAIGMVIESTVTGISS